MDFEQQKPITDEYRRNWERIWGAHVGSGSWDREWGPYPAGRGFYPNGCPIIPEGPQRDDL